VARPGSNPGPPKLGAEENPDRLGRGFLLLIRLRGATFASSAAFPHPATRLMRQRPEKLPLFRCPAHDIENTPTRDEESRYPSRS
jgi:hypothetical protein